MQPQEDRTEAFRRIYLAHYGHISAYARRRLAEHDADDVVAETFLVAWRRLDDVPAGNLTLPWLYGVARRVISQGRRSGRRRDRLVARIGAVRHPDEGVVVETDRLDDRQVVLAALSRLRPEDQEVLRLAEWEGLASPELAVAFGCSTNAAAIRLHRAHKRFSRVLSTIEGDMTEGRGGST